MAGVSSRTKAERFAFIKSDTTGLAVRCLCTLLQVSFQGFYKWKDRPESARKKANRDLANTIEEIFVEHDGNYGSLRVHAELCNQGLTVNLKRVERIMRNAGLVGKAEKLYRRKAVQERFYLKYPNLKLELPELSKINQQWAGDITYLKVNGQWSYLAVVMDLHSRRIMVGH